MTTARGHFGRGVRGNGGLTEVSDWTCGFFPREGGLLRFYWVTFFTLC
jgi:hypothetical protein